MANLAVPEQFSVVFECSESESSHLKLLNFRLWANVALKLSRMNCKEFQDFIFLLKRLIQ